MTISDENEYLYLAPDHAEKKKEQFLSLRMLLALGFSYSTFTMLRLIPFILIC